MSELGSVYTSRNIRLKDLRKWHIKGFNNFLIFYRVQDDAVEIIRILYATQDIKGILGKEV
jgi:toxin ParE1/3/4